MIQSIAAMREPARALVYDKAWSGAEHDRKTAVTLAMREAPAETLRRPAPRD